MPRKRRRHLLYEKRKRRQQQLESSAAQSPADSEQIDAHTESHHERDMTEVAASPPKKQLLPYQIKNGKLHHFLKPLNHLFEKEKDELDLPYSFVDEAFCIEAKVTVQPDVSVGAPTIECLEAEILPSSHQHSSSEECTMLISQIVRIIIPVRFSAKANAEASDVRLAHDDENSTNDSSL